MSQHHVSEDTLFFFEKQEVIVDDFDAAGYILDIGGGGEGIIGQFKGQQVIAIDPNKKELAEASPGPLKVIMDARELQFLDHSFSAATSFFTLMYIKEPDHKKVFQEVFRILAPGGLFLIWDVILPERLDQVEDIAVFPLAVKLPNQEISTGYGTLWPDQKQDLTYYLQLAKKVGFDVITQQENGRVLFLQLRKR